GIQLWSSARVTSLGMVCLPNVEIFAGLAQMGYEKPSTKLTFYKAFFSSQWKFLIHTILQSLSAKRTSWNEFSTAMASVVICLSKGHRFNFSRYIFDSLVRNVDSSSKFYMYPRFIQLIIQAQVVDLSSHTTRYISPSLTQKVPAQDDVAQENVIEEIADDVAQPTSPLPPSPVIPSSPPHQSPRTSPSQAAEGSSILVQQVLDKCSALVLRVEGLEQADTQAEIYNIDLDHTSKVLSMQEDTKVQEVVEVVNADKLMTEVATTAASIPIPVAKPVVAAVSTPISAAKPKVLKIVLVALTVSTRKRKGVVIRDPEEELHDDTLAETQSAKDKGKGIFVEDPKPTKKKDQIAMDAERYHGYKKKPQSESEAWKNMIDYLKNTKGFKLAFFKGKKYDQIRLIFQARFDANMRFLLKSKEEMEKEEEEIIKSINETPAQKAAKRRRLREQGKEDENLKKQLEVVVDEDDDVFVKATPIGTKVPVVNYEVVMINNKPRYKIFRADDTHQLYTSFITLLKNFNREDLEDLWKNVKARFSTSMPTNFTDDYLLVTLKNMFEKTDAQDVI
nr:hypothetical protein [Tanacetum cinerariifolium]